MKENLEAGDDEREAENKSDENAYKDYAPKLVQFKRKLVISVSRF